MAAVKRNRDGLKIRISQLSSGIHEYHFSSEPPEIGLESNFRNPVEVDAVVDKTPRQLFLRVKVQTSACFACDRCTEEFERPISIGYNMFYVYSDQETGKYPPDEVQVIGIDTVYIDLTEDVRQMVLVSIPLKLLCKEDCQGLCRHCGMNLNDQRCSCRDETLDPRWESLNQLLKN